MKNIIWVVVCCCIGCNFSSKEKESSDTNSKEVLQPVTNDSLKPNTAMDHAIEPEKDKDSIPTVKPLDYSLKIEDLNSAQDSANFLTHYYEQFTEQKDSLSEVLFFTAFPDNFKDFKKLYGYEDDVETSTGLSVLYSKYEHIINYEPVYIAEETYVKKLVAIAINGYWQSDNIGFLQFKLYTLLVKQPTLVLPILEGLDAIDLESFWFFILDGPSADTQKEACHEIIPILEEYGLTTMKPALDNAFKRTQKEWRNP